MCNFLCKRSSHLEKLWQAATYVLSFFLFVFALADMNTVHTTIVRAWVIVVAIEFAVFALPVFLFAIQVCMAERASENKQGARKELMNVPSPEANLQECW